MTKRLGWLGFVAGMILLLSACSSGADQRAAALKIDRTKMKPVLLDQVPEMGVKLGYVLDNKIEILGYDYEPKPLKRNRPYSVTFYFRALQEIPESYDFFGHVEPVSGRPFRMRMDHTPVGGRFPTSVWHKGDIIKDVYRGKVDFGFPGTEGVLWAGFFRDDTRLAPTGDAAAKAADKDRRVRFGTLSFEPMPNVEMKLDVPRIKDGQITLDGKLDEPAWEQAAVTPEFVNINNEPVKRPLTTAKMLWDSQYLYIAFLCDDEDIWSSYTKRDDPLYKENAVEIMIDADGSGSTYIELQVNPANVVFDVYYPERRKNMQLDFDAKLKTGVFVDGTLNKHDDKDKGWVAEIAIPFASVADAPNKPPKDGDAWRLNLYRMSKPQNRGQIGSMWSPTFVGDFHTLDRFGTVVFRDSKAVETAKPGPAKSAKTPAPHKP